MNFIEKIKITKRKPKVILGKYFLPFSLNEYFLLFTFLLFFCFVFYAYIESNFSTILIFSFLLYLFLFGKIIFHRFFKEIETNLLLHDNNSIIQNIASKQKIVYQSEDIQGHYIFEIPNKKDTEYIVIICENDRIFINNFYDRKLYNLFGNKSIKAIENLILLKTKVLSKQRINNYL